MERIRGYRYRAYPNGAQREFFEKTFGCCRFVYNHYLEARKALWKEWHDTLSYSEMSRDLSKCLKKEKVWLKEADSIALQQSLRHLDRAYQNFFKKSSGYPQFRKKHSKQSYRTMNVGGMIQNPRTLALHEKRIKRLQRRLSRKKKGSKNRSKARIRLAREHEKVADIRNDYQHKVTAKLAKENQIVCIEDLNVKGMMRNHNLAKSISDTSWGEFCRKLEYKMADHGGIVIKVPRNYASSQLCSCCGTKNPELKDLSVRNWVCPVCGAEHDRDINAAKNILAKGLEMLAP